jgi:hypothetical protein
MIKTNRLAKVAATAIVVAVFVAATAGNALAQYQDWNKEHAHRAEVNARLANQNKRINQERKEGEITKAQAHKLHRKDHQIRQEERDMASQNGGHITKQEQRVLNQQENAVSKQIGR